MTNKQLIIKTVEYLKPKSGHTSITDSLWQQLDLDTATQSQLRDILLENELVNLGPDLWTMQLTAKGMLLKKDQLNDDGSFKLENVIRQQKDEITDLQIENLSPL